jgi:signal transduction histidine kinase
MTLASITSVASPSDTLIATVEKLLLCVTTKEVARVVAEAAKAMTGADGVTFVLRDGDECWYYDEEAISPLWKGRRFPMADCISGWSMEHKEVVCIEDIFSDDRVPQEAYRPTFVKSLCMIPIREVSPLGAIGVYWGRTHLASKDEIKVLKLLANSAAVSLQSLKSKNEIFEQAKTLNDLGVRNKELELGSNLLLHDLRSPATVVTVMAEILREELRDQLTPTVLESIQTISSAGERITSHLERIMLLTKSMKQPLLPRPVNITAIANKIFNEQTRINNHRNFASKISDNMHAYGDEFLVQVALENLISNAVKYTKKRPLTEIQIGTAMQVRKGFRRFYVRDNGVGFCPSDANKLFQPLVRLHPEREYSGNGLGLVSVARIFQLHGGTVSAEGKVDQGATFYFELPESD